MKEWHIKVMGEVSGPFSLEELRQLRITNAITFDTLVRPTMGQWKTADQFPELFERRASETVPPIPFHVCFAGSETALALVSDRHGVTTETERHQDVTACRLTSEDDCPIVSSASAARKHA